MPINGKVQCIDWCIHRIVAALNAGGVRTVASCCGHDKMDGNIILEDGRVLIIRNMKADLKAEEARAETTLDKREAST